MSSVSLFKIFGLSRISQLLLSNKFRPQNMTLNNFDDGIWKCMVNCLLKCFNHSSKYHLWWKKYVELIQYELDGINAYYSVFYDLVEVVERSSPPAPVEILPSNAGQDIAPTQSAGKTPPLLSSPVFRLLF